MSVAGTGAVAWAPYLAANVITNTVETEISGSTVNAGTTPRLDSESQATILGLSVCVAGSGAAAMLRSPLPPTSSPIRRRPSSSIAGQRRRNVTAGGDVTVTAEDASEIDAFA